MSADGDQRRSVQDQEQRRGARELAAVDMGGGRRQRDAGSAHQRGEDGEETLDRRHGRPPSSRTHVVIAEGAVGRQGAGRLARGLRPLVAMG